VSLDSQNLARTLHTHFSAKNPLEAALVERSGAGRLYSELRFEVEPVVALQPRQSRGFSVSRTYLKQGAEGRWEPARDLLVGERVLVQLRVESDAPAAWVAIDDPLPAVFEAINPHFQAGGSGLSAGSERLWYPNHRQAFASRVVFYCDELPAGRFLFQYLARVRMAGEGIAPQTKVEEMYHPERFGLGASERVEARAR
jgi:uncharacterized protein YfaS (alpha-2-macroglobulin family)